MDKIQPIVSIIIVSYNVETYLINCLDSLFQHKCLVPYEIIVVDNNSQDNSVSSVQKKYPEILVIQSQKNIGFAAANNLASRVANGSYFLLLNPDTIVEDGAIDELYTFLIAHTAAGAAGSYLKNPDGTFQMSCYPFPTLFRELWRLFHLDNLLAIGLYPQKHWDPEIPKKCDVVQGTSLMIKRDVWHLLGGLDEDFFMYSEEVDFCYRMDKAGFERYWVPTSRVIHYGGQSTSQTAREMFLQLYRAKTQFFKKHHGLLAAYLYKLILLLASLARLVLFSLASWLRPESVQRHIQIRDNYKYLIGSLSGF
jgi:GT2 family glycosyltransferase